MNHRAFAAFVVAFASSAALFYPQQGQAFSRYVGATDCHDAVPMQDPVDKSNKSRWTHELSPAYWYRGANGVGDAVCGVPNDTSLDKSEIATFQVHVYDGSTTGRISVRACGASPLGSSTFCGGNTYNGPVALTGPSTVTVADLGAWSGSLNIYSPYLLVFVPKKGDGMDGEYSGIVSYAWSD